MSDWCVTRNMSWDAVESLCREHNIAFDELPVAGERFYEDLVMVSRRPDMKERRARRELQR